MKEALKLALEALEIQAYNSGDEKYTQAITAIKQAIAAPVQDPVAWMQSDEVHISLWKDDYHTIPLYTTPPAQPAVPDAFGTREGEHPQYIQGWNDCRQTMLEILKARGNT